MTKSLAPRSWQADVVDALIHQHGNDRDDVRQRCYVRRFELSEMYHTGNSAADAAAWMELRFSGAPRVLNKRFEADVPAVYIGRGSRYGNPFRIGVDGDRAEVVRKHAAWLRGQHGQLKTLDDLRGRHLMCFCAPLACHGDLLLKLANSTREQRIAWWRCEAA